MTRGRADQCPTAPLLLRRFTPTTCQNRRSQSSGRTRLKEWNSQVPMVSGLARTDRLSLEIKGLRARIESGRPGRDCRCTTRPVRERAPRTNPGSADPARGLQAAVPRSTLTSTMNTPACSSSMAHVSVSRSVRKHCLGIAGRQHAAQGPIHGGFVGREPRKAWAKVQLLDLAVNHGQEASRANPESGQ